MSSLKEALPISMIDSEYAILFALLACSSYAAVVFSADMKAHLG